LAHALADLRHDSFAPRCATCYNNGSVPVPAMVAPETSLESAWANITKAVASSAGSSTQ